jgi:hypothetical protein
MDTVQDLRREVSRALDARRDALAEAVTARCYELETGEGRGTTFRVSLPRQARHG